MTPQDLACIVGCAVIVTLVGCLAFLAWRQRGGVARLSDLHRPLLHEIVRPRSGDFPVVHGDMCRCPACIDASIDEWLKPAPGRAFRVRKGRAQHADDL